MDKIFHSGGEIITIVDANAHKKCLKVPFVIKETIFNMNIPKVRSNYSKGRLG
jgi:hypothetical protein